MDSEEDEEVNILIETAKWHPGRINEPGRNPTPNAISNSASKWKSLDERLIELHRAECQAEPTAVDIVPGSKLLEKLVRADCLNTLVLSLYPHDQGYSLGVRQNNGSDLYETIRLTYEESEFLDDVDNEQIPSMLVDLLDKLQCNVFYSGCVICEICDFRKSLNGKPTKSYVLLRPTQHSLQTDIDTLTCDGHIWSQEDRNNLESALLLATNEPLCLDPSPKAFMVTNKIQAEKHAVNDRRVRRNARRYGHKALTRIRRMATNTAPESLKLYQFLADRKDRPRTMPPVNLKVANTCVDMWRQRDVPLSVPSNIDVEKYAKPLERNKMTIDNTPVVKEEYTFETSRGQGKVNFSRLTIMQRMSDETYVGKLYVDRDYVETRSHGSTCQFPLGTRADVNKYINQFREIFTEEGRRQVKITHYVPGQNPTVSFTNAPYGQVSFGQQGSNQGQPNSAQGHQGQGQKVNNVAQQQGVQQQGTGLAPNQGTNIGQSQIIQGQVVQGQMAQGQVNITPLQGHQIQGHNMTQSAQALLQAAGLGATLTGQLSLPGTGGDGAKRLPIKLSLSINPQVSMATSQPGSAGLLNSGTLNTQQIAAQRQQLRPISLASRTSSAPGTPVNPNASATGVSPSLTSMLTNNQTIAMATSGLPSNSTLTLTTSILQNNPTFTLTTSGGSTIQLGAAQSSFLKPTISQAGNQNLNQSLNLSSGQSATPPPNITITKATTIPMIRRSSNDTTSRSIVAGPVSSANTSSDPSGIASQILASISSSSTSANAQNITPVTTHAPTSMPQNINIQNLTGLQGVNITNLQALQNIQVAVSGQNVTLPISMLSSGNQQFHQSVNQQAGIQGNQPSVRNINSDAASVQNINKLIAARGLNQSNQQQQHNLVHHINQAPTRTILHQQPPAGGQIQPPAENVTLTHNVNRTLNRNDQQGGVNIHLGNMNLVGVNNPSVHHPNQNLNQNVNITGARIGQNINANVNLSGRLNVAGNNPGFSIQTGGNNLSGQNRHLQEQLIGKNDVTMTPQVAGSAQQLHQQQPQPQSQQQLQQQQLHSQQHQQLSQHQQQTPAMISAIQGTNSGSGVIGSGNMLSLPIGVAGNITQFMAGVGLKGTQGIRPGTPLLLSQVPGQQPVQILTPGGGYGQVTPQSTRVHVSPATTPHKHHPESPASTGLMSPPSVPAQSPLQQASPFSPVRQGGGHNQSVTSPQFLQLAPQAPMTHLTIQGGSATPTKAKKKPNPMSPRM